MRYNVVHVTKYNYSDMATLCHNQVHLNPRPCARQTCLRFDLQVTPNPMAFRDWIDAFGNPATYFTIEKPHHELTIASRSQVEVVRTALNLEELSITWEEVVQLVAEGQTNELIDAARYTFDSPHVVTNEDTKLYAAESFEPGRQLIEAVRDLMQRIHSDFQFDPTATSISTPIAEILARGRGVCQDFAHLQIACLRSLGLPARYVSGYIVTLPPTGRERLVGSDASHAWVSVYFPGTGWLDFDPTNNQMPDEEHIVVAWGRDYSDVSPIKGVFLGGGAHSMAVSVDVAPCEFVESNGSSPDGAPDVSA